MAINRAGTRGTKLSGPYRGSMDRGSAIAPCIASAMVYLHHALNQTAVGEHVAERRDNDNVFQLGGLSRSLASRRPWVDASCAELQADEGTAGWAPRKPSRRER